MVIEKHDGEENQKKNSKKENEMKIPVFGNVKKVVIMVLAVSFLVGSMAVAGQQDITGKININEATAKELSALSGIGKKKAEAIVAYRNENGKFENVEDLKNVEGIGKKSFEKIKERISTQ